MHVHVITKWCSKSLVDYKWLYLCTVCTRSVVYFVSVLFCRLRREGEPGVSGPLRIEERRLSSLQTLREWTRRTLHVHGRPETSHRCAEVHRRKIRYALRAGGF